VAASGHSGKTASLRQYPPPRANLPYFSVERYFTLSSCRDYVEKKGRPDVSALLLGVVVVLLSVVVALAGLVLVRRLVSLEHLESHSEATGTIHHAIAIVFGVAAAFAIFLVWEQAGRSASSRKRSRLF
jgi:hypothetical protein